MTEQHKCQMKVLYSPDKYGNDEAVGRFCEECGRITTMKGQDSQAFVGRLITPFGSGRRGENAQHQRRLFATIGGKSKDDDGEATEEASTSEVRGLQPED